MGIALGRKHENNGSAYDYIFFINSYFIRRSAVFYCPDVSKAL